jgi:hypothetical protein
MICAADARLGPGPPWAGIMTGLLVAEMPVMAGWYLLS